MKKVLVVADVSNLYYTVLSKLGGKVSYSQLLKKAIDEKTETLYRAIAYGADYDQETVKFQHALRSIGFETQYKQVKEFRSGERKADWDVGIAMDVVKILPFVDVVVFCTADSDLVPCMEYAANQGRQVRVLGCGISRDIKEYYQYTEIEGSLLESK